MSTKTIQTNDKSIGLSLNPKHKTKGLKPKPKIKTKNTRCVRPKYKHFFYCNEINKQGYKTRSYFKLVLNRL
jgi:hypothetical protein